MTVNVTEEDFSIKIDVAAAGPQGPKGDIGNTGATGLTHRGAWAGATAYIVNDAVTHLGSTYRRKVAGTSATAPNLDAVNWELLAGKGDTGTTGTAATLALGTVTTSTPGSSAVITNSGTSAAAVFNFTLPRGDTGPANTLTPGTITTGAPGSAVSATITGTAPNQTLNLTIPRGDVGASNTLSVGTVITGAEGSNVTVGITGTSPNQTLNFSIPRGNTGPANVLTMGTVTTGAAGSTATAAITGTAPNQTLTLTIPRGDTGLTGPANTLTMGTVTTLATGASATASITGTAPNQTLALGLPRGATGLTGAAGATWYSGNGVPAAGLGADGDYYLNTNTTTGTGDVYKKAAGAWSINTNIRGLPGAGNIVTVNGSTGPNVVIDYASLGMIPSSVLPPLATVETYPVASQAAMLALTAQRGDIAVRTDIGRTYILTAEPATTLANWTAFTAAGDVTSVAGRVGAVILTKADVGLDNVDNTTDLLKPISTATQTALDLKANLTNTVTTDTAQTITGTKIITGGLTVGNGTVGGAPLTVGVNSSGVSQLRVVGAATTSSATIEIGVTAAGTYDRLWQLFVGGGNVSGSGAGTAANEGTFRIQEAGTERIRINKGGAVFIPNKTTAANESSLLIGDTVLSPTAAGQAKVVVANTSGESNVLIGQSGTNNLILGWKYNATVASAYGLIETYGANNPLALQVTGGNVGIGKNNPATKLDVTGTVTATGFTGPGAGITGVVHDTGAETIAGIKTFSSSPAVPDNSWTISDTAGLQSALDAKVNNTSNETIAGSKTFSTGIIINTGAGYTSSLTSESLLFTRNTANYIQMNTVGGFLSVKGSTTTGGDTQIALFQNGQTTLTGNLHVTSAITTSSKATITHTTNIADGLTLTNTTGTATYSPRLFFQNDVGSNAIYRFGSTLNITSGATPGTTSGTSVFQFSDTGTITATVFSGQRVTMSDGTGVAIFSGKQTGAGFSSGTAVFVSDTDNTAGASNWAFQAKVAGTITAAIRADGYITTPSSIAATGNVTASGFFGNGASLTALNGSQVTTGTVPIARLDAGVFSTSHLPEISEVNTLTTALAGKVGLAGTETITGAKTFSSGDITLNNATSNRIVIGTTAGVTGPTNTTRSAGTKFVLYPSLNATDADFALGIESGAMWHSTASTGNQFKWYGGTTLAATLSGVGNLSTVGTVTAGGTGFIGAGSGITSLNGTAINSGTVPVARLDANVFSTSHLPEIAEVNTLTAALAAKAADNAVVHLAGGETISGGKTFTADISMPTANTILNIHHTTYSEPTFTTRGAGTRIVLNNSLSASAADYAIGIGTLSNMWFSVPNSNATMKFQWYGGTTNVMTLDGTGALSVAGGIIAAGQAVITTNDSRLSGNVRTTGNESIAGVKTFTDAMSLTKTTAAPLVFDFNNPDTTATAYTTQAYMRMSVGGTQIGGMKAVNTPLAGLSTKSLYITTDGAFPIAFGTDNTATPKMVIMPTTGRVGIGNQAPTEMLDVTGNITASGSLNLAGGAINLNNATSNMISFSQGGVASPAFTTRSAGTKLILYPQVSGTSVDYAIGMEGSTMWFSLPTAADNLQYKWYGGTTQAMRLGGTGILSTATSMAAPTVTSTATTNSLNMQKFIFTVATAARPTGSAYVQWQGPVQPNNAIDGDEWIKTP